MIIGVGQPCTDVVFYVDDDILKALNVNKGDARNTDWEEFSEAIDICQHYGYSPMITTGGSSSNTIKGLASLGNKTAFIGKIGDDEVGNFYKKTIVDLGISPRLTVTPLYPTTQIAAFISQDQQRSFLAFFGAGLHLEPDDVNDTMMEDAALIHIEGYRLDNFAYTETLMQQAKSQGKKISFDAGCIRIVKTYGNEILRLLKEYVDVFFINNEELDALLGLQPEEGCALLAQDCPVVAVLHGKNGCWVSSQGNIFHSPAMKVTAIDSNGAGDLFASGFLHGYMRGYPLQECAWLGNLLGGTVVTVRGAFIPDEMWPALRQTINDHFNNQ